MARVRVSKGIEWKYDDDIYMWDKRNRDTCTFRVQMI